MTRNILSFSELSSHLLSNKKHLSSLKIKNGIYYCLLDVISILNKWMDLYTSQEEAEEIESQTWSEQQQYGNDDEGGSEINCSVIPTTPTPPTPQPSSPPYGNDDEGGRETNCSAKPTTTPPTLQSSSSPPTIANNNNNTSKGSRNTVSITFSDTNTDLLEDCNIIADRILNGPDIDLEIAKLKFEIYNLINIILGTDYNVSDGDDCSQLVDPSQVEYNFMNSPSKYS